MSHTSVQNAAGHHSDPVEGVSHCIDTCNTTTVGETGTRPSSWISLGAGEQMVPPSPRSAMPLHPGITSSTVRGVWRFLTVMLTRSQSNILDQSVTCTINQVVAAASHCTDTSKAGQPANIGEAGAGTNRWHNWFMRKPDSLTSLDATLYSGRTSPIVCDVRCILRTTLT